MRGIPIKNSPSESEDERVKRERTRVTCELPTLIDEEAVVMHNLSKQFGKQAPECTFCTDCLGQEDSSSMKTNDILRYLLPYEQATRAPHQLFRVLY